MTKYGWVHRCIHFWISTPLYWKKNDTLLRDKKLSMCTWTCVFSVIFVWILKKNHEKQKFKDYSWMINRMNVDQKMWKITTTKSPIQLQKIAPLLFYNYYYWNFLASNNIFWKKNPFFVPIIDYCECKWNIPEDWNSIF